jgi:integrase
MAVLSTWRSQAGEEIDPVAYVFASPQTGGRLDNITTAWEALVEAAKIADFTFHDLRHTFASRLVQRGVDLNVVRELLGHTSLTMTLRYAHLREQDMVEAVRRLAT